MNTNSIDYLYPILFFAGTVLTIMLLIPVTRMFIWERVMIATTFIKAVLSVSREKDKRDEQKKADTEVEQELAAKSVQKIKLEEIADHSNKTQIAKNIANAVLELIENGIMPGSLVSISERLWLFKNPKKVILDQKDLTYDQANLNRIAMSALIRQYIVQYITPGQISVLGKLSVRYAATDQSSLKQLKDTCFGEYIVLKKERMPVIRKELFKEKLSYTILHSPGDLTIEWIIKNSKDPVAKISKALTDSILSLCKLGANTDTVVIIVTNLKLINTPHVNIIGERGEKIVTAVREQLKSPGSQELLMDWFQKRQAISVGQKIESKELMQVLEDSPLGSLLALGAGKN